MNYLHQSLTEQIIRAFYTVYNKMGYGFKEKVYENSLVIEIGKSDLLCSQQYPITHFMTKLQLGIILQILPWRKL